MASYYNRQVIGPFVVVILSGAIGERLGRRRLEEASLLQVLAEGSYKVTPLKVEDSIEEKPTKRLRDPKGKERPRVGRRNLLCRQ